MCGIYMTNMPFSKIEVLNKLEKIKYRGPDNLSYEKINEITLGHLRLSIIDLDMRSNQPFTFKQYKIVYNGEVYNFTDIKKELEKTGYSFTTTSDTEVLIKGYDAWGTALLSKLNGMFAFSIYDLEKNIVFSARDRLGVKPFYYYWKNGKLEICSQMAPLINESSEICNDAVSAYLDCGYVPSPLSILKDVYKLEPGNFMIIDLASNTLEITSYWSLDKVEVNNISYSRAKEELHELLKDAVKIRMHSDVPMGTFLSGGIDSALVSSIASKFSKDPINTFTIGFEDPKFDESKVAKKFSDVIGSNHIENLCSASDVRNLIPDLLRVYDEPFADVSALPSLLLNKEAKEHVTVALSGDGGDESFLGYTHFDFMSKFINISKIPLVLRKMMCLFPWHYFVSARKSTITSILKTNNPDEYSIKTFLGFDSIQNKVNILWFNKYLDFKDNSSDPFQRMADLNIKLWLENDSNVKVDRASMASSVEVRSPFLDYRIVEFARQLPVSYRYKNGIKKRILKDILLEYIPEDLFNLPKRGFTIPLGSWIKCELKEEIQKTLSIKALETIPNLNVGKIQKIIRKHMHVNEKRDYSSSLWRIYILLKWKEKYNL